MKLSVQAHRVGDTLGEGAGDSGGQGRCEVIQGENENNQRPTRT